MAGLFSRLKEGLTKTRQGLVDRIGDLVAGQGELTEEFYEELEEILIRADVGVETSMRLAERIRQRAKQERIREALRVKDILRDEIVDILGEDSIPLNLNGPPPSVILVVGVNGAGKTTTIGKLAHKLSLEGKKVLLAAGDTFRAAAIDQLEVWGRRVGAQVIRHQEGADPAAVAFDAIQSARARGSQVVIVDTAGRLQNKTNLMEEVKKVRRVIEREIPEGPQEVLLVLDATTGQNAISQAKLFGKAVGVTGIALTKLDGTAKGGVIIGIRSELEIPVKLIGIGEGVDDLREFNPREFVTALFAEQE
ncbi:signal peptide protein [Clostridiales bacterium PH28_bin88]|nr:signal peptide protein [Clostridiales bacterium PH28_bin88]